MGVAEETEINKILKDHEKRIFVLESIIKPKKIKHEKIKKAKKSLPDHIIELREIGFFSQPKTVEDTHKKVQGTYPCELDRVRMALLRLANKRELRKTTKIINNKKYKGYVW